MFSSEIVRCSHKRRHRRGSGTQVHYTQVLDTGGTSCLAVPVGKHQGGQEAEVARGRGEPRPEPFLGFPKERQGRAGQVSSLNYFCSLQAGGVVPGGPVPSPGLFKAEECCLLGAQTSWRRAGSGCVGWHVPGAASGSG